MLEGYKPIDFSSVLPPLPMGQMRNRVGLSQVAMDILANSKFSQTPISQLKGMGLDAEGNAPPRKQTLWGRTVDLLSTPAYAVSNAIDDAIAGHQKDDDDNVLEDAIQIIGGLGTGAGRGTFAGLRGAFAPSATAANPEDKIYLDKAIQRWDTGMSPEELADPKNQDELRARLEQIGKGDRVSSSQILSAIPIAGGWLSALAPNIDENVTDEEVNEYMKDTRIQGLVGSMALDPLNFIGAPIRGAKGLAEVPELGADVINKGMPKPLPKAPPKDGSYKVTIPAGSVQNKVANPATGELIDTPDWFKFPSSAADMPTPPTSAAPINLNSEAWKKAQELRTGNYPDWMIDTLLRNSYGMTPEGVKATIAHLDDGTDPFVSGARVTETSPVANTSDIVEGVSPTKPVEIKGKPSAPVAKVPDNQIRIAEQFSDADQANRLTGNLLRLATEGRKDWGYAMSQRLTERYPGVEFVRTQKLINHVAQIPNFSKRLAIPQERAKIQEAFRRVIQADAESMKTPKAVKTADEIINEASSIGPVQLDRVVSGATPNNMPTKNPKRDAKVAQDVYNKFQDQILGKGRPTGIKNPGAYDASVASGRTAKYSGSQQVQMWNNITHNMKQVKTPNRFAVANNILRQVEDMFIAKGAAPMSGIRTADSVPLRLSQVLDAIGPAAAAMNPTLLTKILRGDPKALSHLPAEVLQKIEELKAGESLVDSSKAIQGIDAATKNIDELIKGPLSAARTEEVVTIGSKVAEDISAAAGASPVAKKTAGKITKNSFITRAPGDGFPSVNTVALIRHPSVSNRLVHKFSNVNAINKDISKLISSPPPRQLARKWGPSALVPEWLGARFNAAYKNADMRPIYLRQAATAKSTVARRAEYLNNLARQYDINDADLWNDALKGAQGVQAPPVGSQAHALSQEILQVMENMFGSSGLKESVALENSVAGRSQLFMKELNQNLKRFGLGEYQFTKSGEKYSKGAQWLNSWESWDIKKPLDFMFKMQNVVEHTVREKIMFDDIISRFGTPKKAPGFTHTVNHPRLQGYYFGKEAASQVNQFVRVLKDVRQTNSKALQNFDKALSKWKAAVTIYIPSHHIRNMIGDAYFNWLSGVNSARPYSTAIKVMKSQKGRYDGLDEMASLTSPDALKKVLSGRGAPGAAGKQIALTMRSGEKVTNDMVYVSAFQQGILPTTRVLEDIPDDMAMGMEKFRPLGGRGQRTAHHISEGRDHYMRLAHYIDVLKKSNSSFAKASDEAAAAVRKWHPDGMDLTKFERNVMRRMFPFYSWTRKAFPLIIESMVATPGKVMAIPKAQYLLQNALGIETGPMSDPFPYDQLFPDWIREKGIGPVMGPAGDYGIINPGNPTMDVISQANNPGGMAMGMLNPGARIPIELATGKEAQTGAPIGGVTDTDYLVKQIPGLSHAGRATGEFGVSDTTKENSSGINFQNILNMLTAAGYQRTGQYQKSAEFDLREYLRSQR